MFGKYILKIFEVFFFLVSMFGKSKYIIIQFGATLFFFNKMEGFYPMIPWYKYYDYTYYKYGKHITTGLSVLRQKCALGIVKIS